METWLASTFQSGVCVGIRTDCLSALGSLGESGYVSGRLVSLGQRKRERPFFL